MDLFQYLTAGGGFMFLDNPSQCYGEERRFYSRSDLYYVFGLCFYWGLVSSFFKGYGLLRVRCFVASPIIYAVKDGPFLLTALSFGWKGRIFFPVKVRIFLQYLVLVSGIGNIFCHLLIRPNAVEKSDGSIVIWIYIMLIGMCFYWRLASKFLNSWKYVSFFVLGFMMRRRSSLLWNLGFFFRLRWPFAEGENKGCWFSQTLTIVDGFLMISFIDGKNWFLMVTIKVSLFLSFLQ